MSRSNKQVQAFRAAAVSSLSVDPGVYALCDLDGTPIYVGHSTDSITARVARHLTSARSDVIANRLVDIWEIAYVRFWVQPGADKATIEELEANTINYYNDKSPIFNGKISAKPASYMTFAPGEYQTVPVLPPDELEERRDFSERLVRQHAHVNSLLHHMLEVKNNTELRRVYNLHVKRLHAMATNFLSMHGEGAAQADLF